MSVITRFAPSPTGFLHIGGARTALFNWLFAKANQGKFLLRIEDTDRLRSTDEAVKAIISGLQWLGIDWDGEVVMQFARSKRHAEIATQLLDLRGAYRCYLTAEEIKAMKDKDPYVKIISPWRDGKKPAAVGIKPTIRLKVDQCLNTTIYDIVRGEVLVSNQELDDTILLRSDGTPTYMLSAVVDDYDMKVTHVIRGDDHFTNSFRQQQIIQALQWPVPIYAHVPLIHGPDGTKLSKRHGALGIEVYQRDGYLPEAICNYLLRLGWSNGDLEIVTKEEAVKVFTLEALNKTASRFDYNKLNFLNAHYISKRDDANLMKLLRFDNSDVKNRVTRAMPDLKIRVNTINKLQELADLYFRKKTPADNKAQEILNNLDPAMLLKIKEIFANINDWTLPMLKQAMEDFAQQNNLTNSKIMQIMRALIIGSFKSPSIYKTLVILGKTEVINRL